MIRDDNPGSNYLIRILIFFTHPGSRIQGSKGHRIPDPDPGFGSARKIFSVRTLNKSYDISQKLMTSIVSAFNHYMFS